MIRITFRNPLTALEIRDPSVKMCREIAHEYGLYATFHQPQQPALDGNPRQSHRNRIGNGKHKNWLIDFQEDHPSKSRPKVVGRIALMAPYYPQDRQFGGFSYGKSREPKPTYNFITVHTSSELTDFNPIDPSPEILQKTYQGLLDIFETPYPRLPRRTN